MVYLVDKLNESKINPITNLPYDDTWVAYCLTDADDYKMMVGNSGGAVYTARVSRKYTGWKMSVCDFIHFHESGHKNIILSVSPKELEEAHKCYKGHHFRDPFLREDEPEVLVHSTTYENWLSIREDNCLKSWNLLKSEKAAWEENPIGRELGDPADFCDYIMFSDGSVSSELVVLSKQNGMINMDPEMQYRAGVRLYLDIRKIANDGLLIRDGVHLKVKDYLPLEPYLIWYATWDRVGFNSDLSTPRAFAQKSNEMFHHLFVPERS